MTIRTYNKKDWPEILDWWIAAKEIPPPKESMTTDSTFILEVNNEMMASITIYLTNCKEVAFLENIIRNPKFKNKDGIQSLVQHAELFIKENGYKRLIGLFYKDKLKNRMQTMGYKKTLDNLSSLVKEL
jgi:hypothetical protein